MADNIKNNNVVEDLHSLSKLGGDGVLRDSHSYPGHYIRTRESLTVVRDYYDSFDIVYNANDLPTQVSYFAGTAPHLTTIACKSDIAFSLQSKYFFLYAAQANTQFYLWYNVDGLGTDPSIANSIGIEIPIASGDDKTIVANATQLILNMSVHRSYFNVTRAGSIITITNKNFGPISDTLDSDTTFVFNNTAGERDLVQKVNIDYNGINPIFNGQELVGYAYNVYSSRFELIPESNVNLNPIISRDPEIFNVNMPVSGTEYSLVLPLNTKRFSIKIQGNLSSYEVAYVSGGTTYSISRGTEYSEEGIELSTGNTIYFKSNKNTMVMEVITWK